jgi:two-component system nitrogen regulation response regulator GlnG
LALAVARRCLEGYDWPGNVRELQSVLKYGIIQAPGEVLTLDCLPEPDAPELG